MLAKYEEQLKKRTAKCASPEELPYMKHVIRMLEFLGSWPYKDLGLKILMPNLPYKLLFFVYCCGLTSGLSYLLKNIKRFPFIEMGQTYITVFMNVIIAQRMTMSWFPSYKKTLIYFIRHIHLFHYKNKSEYHEKIYNDVHFILHYFVLIMVIQGVLAGCAFLLMPAYFNYLYGMYRPKAERPPNMTFDQSVFYDVPFDYTTELGGHIVVFMINAVLVPHSAFCYVGLDVWLMVIVINLWGHVKILKNRLYTFPVPKNTESPDMPPFYTPEEMKTVTKQLVDIIKYHKLIRDYNDEVEDAFGFMMCIYSLFYQVCLCILLLKCAQNNIAETIRYGLILAYMIQQLIIISVVFETLSTQSETLKDAVYAVPWECMDTNNRKIVHILLFVSQKTMEFTAMGMVRIGVQTMSTILKTTFSYFMLLKTFAE